MTGMPSSPNEKGTGSGDDEDADDGRDANGLTEQERIVVAGLDGLASIGQLHERTDTCDVGEGTHIVHCSNRCGLAAGLAGSPTTSSSWLCPVRRFVVYRTQRRIQVTLHGNSSNACG